MRLSAALLTSLLILTTTAADVDGPTIEILTPAECTRKTRVGDTISVHYRGSLASDGTQFDSSYDRGAPLIFAVGRGNVIKG
jgi:FK506-binding protein 2